MEAKFESYEQVLEASGDNEFMRAVLARIKETSENVPPSRFSIKDPVTGCLYWDLRPGLTYHVEWNESEKLGKYLSVHTNDARSTYLFVTQLRLLDVAKTTKTALLPYERAKRFEELLEDTAAQVKWSPNYRYCTADDRVTAYLDDDETATLQYWMGTHYATGLRVTRNQSFIAGILKDYILYERPLKPKE